MNNLSPATIAAYSPGGSAYSQLQGTYGTDAANLVYTDAIDGGGFGNAIADVRTNAHITAVYQNDTSTVGNFAELITTDPLGAPLDGANDLIGKSVLSFLRNPWVIVAVIALAFYFLGGFGWLQRRIAKAS